MKTLKIVGVPEHFNHPWHKCLERNDFAAAGINLEWTDIPEGTGKMCEMLRSGAADIAVILTEGIVKDIEAGNPSKIVQVYVESPLVWGIHVAANSPYRELAELENAKVAISRIGSGSQLMAYVNAANQNWDTDSLEFKIVNTIDGAIQALTDGSADYFMWERFMTKPLVDRGIFRRIADCPTPWPCFVIAVRNELLDSDPNAIATLLSVINRETAKFKSVPGIVAELAEKFHQQPSDIAEWLAMTKWSQHAPSADMLNNVQNQLLELSIIAKKSTFADVVKAL